MFLPNSTVYKCPIRNFTSNPNRRETFTVGIGYDDTIPEAQELALQVLRNHPAVPAAESTNPSTIAEGGLATVAKTIESQAQGSRLPEDGKDLLSS